MTAREAMCRLSEFLPPRSNDGGTPDTNDTKKDRKIDDGGTVDTTDTKTEGKGLGGGQ